MEKQVMISIRSKQAFTDMAEDAIELVTEGVLCIEAGTYLLSYEESELTGMEGTTTTFRVEPDCVTLERRGKFNSQMVFRRGQRDLSLYETPYGALTMGVTTRSIRSTLSGQGGELEIRYAIELDRALAGENFFQIRVTEKRGRHGETTQ